MNRIERCTVFFCACMAIGSIVHHVECFNQLAKLFDEKRLVFIGSMLSALI